MISGRAAPAYKVMLTFVSMTRSVHFAGLTNLSVIRSLSPIA